MDTIRTIEAEGLKKDIPEFRPGDHVKVHVRVVEGDKSRSRCSRET
jgi:large subunit ribosomal protein L19